MSVDLPTGERIYQAVKAEILAGGFRFGERIEAVQLARRHLSSITPIRAALHRLVGEGLVDARAGEGFQAPLVTEIGLRDLYAWNGHILQLGWRLWAHERAPLDAPISAAIDPGALQDVPTAAAALFSQVGRRSRSEACAAAIETLNDRLHLARLQETRLFDGLQDELRRTADPLGGRDPAAARQAIEAYHRRRIRQCADLVDLMRHPPSQAG